MLIVYQIIISKSTEGVVGLGKLVGKPTCVNFFISLIKMRNSINFYQYVTLVLMQEKGGEFISTPEKF